MLATLGLFDNLERRAEIPRSALAPSNAQKGSAEANMQPVATIHRCVLQDVGRMLKGQNLRTRKLTSLVVSSDTCNRNGQCSTRPDALLGGTCGLTGQCPGYASCSNNICGGEQAYCGGDPSRCADGCKWIMHFMAREESITDENDYPFCRSND